MKKLLLKINILCLAFFCVLLSGCKSIAPDQSQKLSVVAVNFPQYDFARAVCGNMADVTMLIRPGAEVHGYEPSLSDIMAIQNADVFVYGGGESDVWVKRILQSVNNPKLKVVALMDIPSLSLYSAEGTGVVLADHGHDHNHYHSHESAHLAGDSDEHVWTSPKNAITIVNYLAECIAEADAENKDYYKANSAEYVKKLEQVDKKLLQTVKDAKNNVIAVADRFPFVYMAKDYGINYIAAFSGCSPESDAGPRVIAQMTEEIAYHNLENVFYIELSNQKMADAISEHTGTKKLLLHSCQNVTEAEFKSGVTYVELMEQNIINLKEALG